MTFTRDQLAQCLPYCAAAKRHDFRSRDLELAWIERASRGAVDLAVAEALLEMMDGPVRRAPKA